MSWPCLPVMAVHRHVPSVPAGTGSPLACVTMSLSVASGLLSPAGGSLVAGSYLHSCALPRARCGLHAQQVPWSLKVHICQRRHPRGQHRARGVLPGCTSGCCSPRSGSVALELGGAECVRSQGVAWSSAQGELPAAPLVPPKCLPLCSGLMS